MEYETDLLRAIREGNVVRVKSIIQSGVDVNATDEHGFAPLHHCSTCRNLSIIRSLIRARNVELNKKTPFYQTPLFLAAYHNNFIFYNILLKNGADPNVEVMFGQTVLHFVVKEGRFNFVKVLIKHGADVNYLDCFGVSPLRVNLNSTMDIKITKLLLENGANFHETKFEQISVLNIALIRWRFDGLKNFSLIIKQGADMNATDFFGKTALHWGVLILPPSIIRMIVTQYGANLMARNMFGHKPIHIARLFGKHEMVDILKNLEDIEIEHQMQLLGI